MKKHNRILTIVALVLIIAMVMMPVTAYAGGKGGGGTGGGKPPATSTTINYVALGDSIATGTVLGSSRIDSYVTYFYQYLKSYYGRKTTVNIHNLAEDGDRSNELLVKLGEQAFIDKLAIADVITISIGGNNLMQATNIPGFSAINATDANQGVSDFQAQWPQIIDKIKAVKKESAKLIVTTVYNPFNSINTPGYQNDATLHADVDGYLAGINGMIYQYSSSNYLIADVYSGFDEYSNGRMGTITYFYPIFSYLRNPHPNSNGQKIITELHQQAFNATLQ